MPAHPAAAELVRPAWSWGLAPALVACLAAPAFFVLRVPWLGWVLLAAALAGAWWVERRAGRGAHASTPLSTGTAASGLPAPEASARPPSLVRDLSLIGAGLLIVSAIPLAAELDNPAFLR